MKIIIIVMGMILLVITNSYENDGNYNNNKHKHENIRHNDNDNDYDDSNNNNSNIIINKGSSSNIDKVYNDTKHIKRIKTKIQRSVKKSILRVQTTSRVCLRKARVAISLASAIQLMPRGMVSVLSLLF